MSRTPGAKTLEDVLLDMERAIQRLEYELDELREAIRESGGLVADPGSRSEPEGAAGAGDPV